jgi:gamma-glutamylcyclotransferase (GGCT)/AIG2-like uncharacterized protein YtfP
MQHVFVYGTLLFPEVVHALTGLSFRHVEGKLLGFKRYALDNAGYPAALPCSGSFVKGKVLLDVDDHSFQILRFYEGNEFEAFSTLIETEEGRLPATVFIWRGERELLSGTWDEQHFADHLLEEYIHSVVPATLKEFEESGS